jgi:hypothetical protein
LYTFNSGVGICWIEGVLQPVELRPDPDVLARQIAATTTKEKRVVGEAAQPSSKKSRVRSEV